MDPLFMRNEMLWGASAQARLRHAHVILFGLGGVGSYAAEVLVRSGVGELTIVDNDTVSLTNCNRQLEALSSTLGQRKTDAVARRLLDINPALRLHPLCATYDAAHRDLFFPEGCSFDYIADAIDLVSCKLDLVETALHQNIPILTTLGTGNKLDPTLLQVSDISRTYGCPLARVMRKELRKRGIVHLQVIFSPEEPANRAVNAARETGLAASQTSPSDSSAGAACASLPVPPPGRRSIPASCPWVPACAGLLLGSTIVRQLIETEGANLC